MSSSPPFLSIPLPDDGEDLVSVTQGLLPGTDQYTTFSQRNPSKDIIPLRSNGDRSVALTGDDAALRRRAKQDTTSKLDAAIEAHLERQRAAMEAMAHEQNVPLAIIEQRCNHMTVYRKARKVNLANAITHAKSKEYNQDLPMGERLRLAEIVTKIQSESTSFSKEEKATLIEELEQHRRLKKTGARANNKAAGKDAAATIARFQQELLNLHERTGIHGFALFARGHLDDANCMEACETPGALDFIPAVLEKNVQDVIRLFDNHTSSKGVLGPLSNDKCPALRAELSETIAKGLQIAISNKRTKMNYASYQTTIVQKQHVEIVGWPGELPIVAPSEMSSVIDLRHLVGLWRTGACRWRTMSAEQIREHTKEMEKLADTGVIQRRKERSDKGTTRKRKSANVENEVSPPAVRPSKRPKQARNKATPARKDIDQSLAAAATKIKKTLPPKSREFIDSDSDEDDYANQHDVPLPRDKSTRVTSKAPVPQGDEAEEVDELEED